METFESIVKSNRLLFEYIAGSHLYNLNNEDSDVDSYSDSGFYDNPLYDSDDDW